jgi:hypothetical protein
MQHMANFFIRFSSFIYMICFSTNAKAFATGGAVSAFFYEISEFQVAHIFVSIFILVVKSFVGSIAGLACKKFFEYIRILKSGGSNE